MKVLLFVFFAVCDVVFRLYLNKTVFRSLKSNWRLGLAGCYFVLMMRVYTDAMGGDGLFGPYKPDDSVIIVWVVSTLCVVLLFFHLWAITSRMDD
ncbi:MULTISPECIES: hypothetical protein [Pseudomonas]|uniref:hypothetical protein n=1 Tax=Pseudomonas TaxID=286 RepID=UPI00224A5CBF|nr:MULTISPECIES: hypothetical protein [unclassified Pseudomonas]MCX2888386.1 hypothetical protein [Pseudomonas sp. DCB_BI]MDH4549306.1 hypothetical protein [Pseudomonas sp. BN607]